MPKSSKKRKANVADFMKPKLKVGKVKPPPSNAVDTSFKARSIALPTQSITIEKDQNIPTTKRKLSFDDLTSHVKHHNAGVRRDSILGFRELFEAHPDLIQSSLSPLLHACAKLIGDEDATVRKILLSFLSWLLPKVPQDILAPHSSILLLFTASAQTHIFPEIRVDAVRFLDIFLEYFPDILVDGWKDGGQTHGGRILEGYLGLLNTSSVFGDAGGLASTTSTLNVTLSPRSKMIVLQSLSTFLRHALSDFPPFSGHDATRLSIIPSRAWYLCPSFSSSDAFDIFHELLVPSCQKNIRTPCRLWKTEPDFDHTFFHKFHLAKESLESPWTLQQLSDVANVQGSFTNANRGNHTDSNFIARLARGLYPNLISTFLDHAPEAFSPNGSTSDVELRLVTVASEITRSLYAVLLQQSSTNQGKLHDNLRSFLGHMAVYFPFQASCEHDIKTEEALQNLNIIFCELSSLLIFSSESACPTGTNKRRLAHVDNAVPAGQAERVSHHVIQLLRGESGFSGQLGRPLALSAYIALAPTIWSLLNNSSLVRHAMTSNVLAAVIDHAIKTPAKSAVKRATVELMGRLILMETEHAYQGDFRVEKHPEEFSKLKEWVMHLPRMMWEIGSQNLLCTETIVRFLLRLFQRRSSLADTELIEALCPRLVPYFSIIHAVKGQLPGPFSRLPTNHIVRKLTLDMIATLRSVVLNDHGLGLAVQQAVNSESLSQPTHVGYA